MLPHRKAAVFTARRRELLEVVQTTLVYLHPDSRVHSFLSPLSYQVSVSQPIISDSQVTLCIQSNFLPILVRRHCADLPIFCQCHYVVSLIFVLQILLYRHCDDLCIFVRIARGLIALQVFCTTSSQFLIFSSAVSSTICQVYLRSILFVRVIRTLKLVPVGFIMQDLPPNSLEGCSVWASHKKIPNTNF